MHDANTFTVFHVRLDKNMTVGQYACEFQDKPWSSSGLGNLIRKIDDTGGTHYTNGSGRPLSLNPKIGHKTTLT